MPERRAPFKDGQTKAPRNLDFESPVKDWKPTIRRRRIALSCSVCRSRKVRCDRQTPCCRRCSLGGCSSLCTYEENGDAAQQAKRICPSADEHPTPMMVRSNQDHWQQPTRPGPIWRTPAPVVTVPDANSSSSTSEHCRCNGSSTSDLVALLQSYDDLDYSSRHPLESSALPDAIAISPQSIAPSHLPYQYVPHQYSTSSLACAASLPNIAGTLSKLASRYLPSSTYTGDSCSQRDARSKTSDPGDVNLCPLPSEFRCRQLMAIYFQHYNATLRIIHEPVFWQRFNEVWTEAEPATDAFCYVLLTAMSCVRCLEPEVSMTYDWDGSSASREAEVWIKQVQRWDKRQGLKHATLEMLQVKCLLMLSMKINLIKMRAHYTASQTLLATAIAMGYHKDLGSTTDQTSFYDREMRRRLWFAVTELELAECTEKGIQSLVENLSVTVGPPSNVDDASFDDHSTFAPPEQPDQVYTDSSPARHCSRLQPTRYRVIAIANDAPRHASLSPGEIADIHEQLVSQLDETLANGVFRPATADRDSAFGKTVLQLLLHESLILLHLPFALTSPGKAQNYQSRLVCQESARSTIELHADLQESGLNQAAIPRTYLQRAVLVLCRLDALSPIQNPIYSRALDPSVTIELVLKTLDLFEERFFIHGNGSRGFWLTFAASCYLRQNADELAACRWEEDVSRRIISACRLIAMSQIAGSHGQQHQAAVFARYMWHIKRAGVFAGLDVDEPPTQATDLFLL